jgi:hypothetical protein
MTIMLRGDDTFTSADYDDLLGELRRHWSGMPNPQA